MSGWKRHERIGDCDLYLGDCLEVMPKLGPVDAVVTDPPYAIPTMVASGRTITRNVGDLSIIEGAFAQHSAMWKNLLGETGRAFVFCDGTSYPVMFRSMYGRFNLASLVWDKGRIGMGREFRKQHELIIHAWGASTPVVSSQGTGYSDVISCPPVHNGQRVHRAQKPTALIESLLRVTGNRVLDPFMGSGSTLLACAKLGRSGVGIEIDPDYFDIACRRVEEAYRMTSAAPAPEPRQETLL